jgi:hypothetical protein
VALPPYTEEMRARAKAWIAERYKDEDEALVFRKYIEVCFTAFKRRITR